MDQLVVDAVKVSVSYASDNDERVTKEEIRNYIARARNNYPEERLNSLKLEIEGEEVGITYGFGGVPFDRIRRITGYLVGTLDRFNDAKRAEEHERVKHSVSCGC